MANGSEHQVPGYYKFTTFLLTGVLIAVAAASVTLGSRLGSDRAQFLQVEKRLSMLEDRQQETAAIIVSMRIEQAKISLQLDRIEAYAEEQAK